LLISTKAKTRPRTLPLPFQMLNDMSTGFWRLRICACYCTASYRP